MIIVLKWGKYSNNIPAVKYYIAVSFKKKQFNRGGFADKSDYRQFICFEFIDFFCQFNKCD